MNWKKLKKGLTGMGRATTGGIGAANRTLDKAHFMKIDPKEFIGYNPSQHRQTPSQAAKPLEQKAPKELIYCPMCGWVYAPHHHKLVEV